MELVSFLQDVVVNNVTHDIASLSVVLLVIMVLAHLVPYLSDPAGLRAYPGPSLAKLSKAWLARIAYHGRVNASVHEAHEEYGKVKPILSSSRY